MNPSKVERSRVASLTDLPNIGEACAKDLRILGIHKPAQLVGKTRCGCTGTCARRPGFVTTRACWTYSCPSPVS